MGTCCGSLYACVSVGNHTTCGGAGRPPYIDKESNFQSELKRTGDVKVKGYTPNPLFTGMPDHSKRGYSGFQSGLDNANGLRRNRNNLRILNRESHEMGIRRNNTKSPNPWFDHAHRSTHGLHRSAHGLHRSAPLVCTDLRIDCTGPHRYGDGGPVSVSEWGVTG